MCVGFFRTLIVCALRERVMKSAPVGLKKFLFQILGHMRPPLSGTV